MADIEITQAVDAEIIANELISEFHPHLRDARIVYLFTNQERKYRGDVVLGTAQRLGSLPKYFSSGEAASLEDGYDFCILLSEDQWKFLNVAQRRALIDHQLSHCGIRRTINHLTSEVTEHWCLLAHDVEEFRGVIERHGLWRLDLRQFAETAIQHRQPTLFDQLQEDGAAPQPEELPPAETLPTTDLAAEAMAEAGWTLPPTTNGHPHTEADAAAEANFAASRRK
jgi:hypothetical protein